MQPWCTPVTGEEKEKGPYWFLKSHESAYGIHLEGSEPTHPSEARRARRAASTSSGVKRETVSLESLVVLIFEIVSLESLVLLRPSTFVAREFAMARWLGYFGVSFMKNW